MEGDVYGLSYDAMGWTEKRHRNKREGDRVLCKDVGLLLKGEDDDDDSDDSAAR